MSDLEEGTDAQLGRKNKGSSETLPQGELTRSHSFEPQERRRGEPEQYIKKLELS